MNPRYILSIILLLNGTLYAQSLEGFVVDELGSPIQAVDILNTSSGHHAHTNENGLFVFDNYTIGDTLQISHVSCYSDEWIVEDVNNPPKIVLYTKSFDLEEVVILPRLDALNLITDIDIKANPVNSSQDVLRKVSGLFIGQHAGGGKAEQIFLRGFDIDHGTDITLTVDGLPVNMVSHAHGQGYADLHFVIPETIENIDFGKGPYYKDQGNFNTAGYVNFNTKKSLDKSAVKLELGQFDTKRIMGMFNLVNDKKHSAYVATEFLFTDGPFESSQNFNRINLFGKYSGTVSNTDKIGLTVSRFTSEWDASGQIPERSVASGDITRFGAIDDTEGGKTTRTNFLVNHTKFLDDNTFLKSSVFISHYDFELFSNFTFFLEDPINGDQIRQRENRIIYGLNSEYSQSFSSGSISGSWQAGISMRNDQITDNELSRTLNRSETLEQLSYGDVNETNLSVYTGATFDLGNWSFIPGLRVDYFDFQYNDKLQTTYSNQSQSSAIVSPKFNILYSPSHRLQLYLKTGKGFHSNDTRVVVTDKDRETLPSAYGFDAGFIWKPNPKMFFNVAYWWLFLEQEFVYVGDAGIVEPSGETSRQGVELNYRYQPLPWLFWNLDANFTHARSINEDEGNDFIPLAPDLTIVTGLNVQHKSGWYGGLNVRYLDDRPANENNSIVAEGYTVADMNLGFKWKKLNLGIQVQNLFDTEWNETQFATESRLFDEVEPVEEIHFTPGTPFFIKGVVEYNF